MNNEFIHTFTFFFDVFHSHVLDVTDTDYLISSSLWLLTSSHSEYFFLFSFLILNLIHIHNLGSVSFSDFSHL